MTRNRRQWLPRAIRCYQQQTYPCCELLIIADGEDVRDLLPADPTIRYLYVTGKTEIGAKRNFGVERAAGEIVAHWDDDDYSAPGRLADQIARMLESQRPVTGYQRPEEAEGQGQARGCGSPGKVPSLAKVHTLARPQLPNH